MRKMLQVSENNATGDWFLYQNATVVRIYGFEQSPYMFPAFFTPRIFDLEFVKQIIIDEEQIFTSSHRASNFKFNVSIVPFVFKNISCLSIIQEDLMMFNFQIALIIKYDPIHLIFERRKKGTNVCYEHEVIEGLDKIENQEEQVEGKVVIGLVEKSEKESSQSIETSVDAITLYTPIQKEYQHRRSISGGEDMDVDQYLDSKMMKIDKGKEIIDVSEETIPKSHVGVLVVQEEHANVNT